VSDDGARLSTRPGFVPAEGIRPDGCAPTVAQKKGEVPIGRNTGIERFTRTGMCAGHRDVAGLDQRFRADLSRGLFMNGGKRRTGYFPRHICLRLGSGESTWRSMSTGRSSWRSVSWPEALRYACGVIRRTNADLIIQALLGVGVERLFGMPGGGSNADIIEAARRAGLPFTLAHTEAASAFMAAAQAEITGNPGACLATLGPGAASLMNGLAHAFLDRVPLIAITDCYPDRGAAGRGHQALAQSDIFRPVVKFTARLERGRVAERMSQAIEAATDGPVHLDVSAEVTAADGEGDVILRRVSPRIEPPVRLDARRPVLLIGLAARTHGISALCERFRVPALVTYKAKGVVPDRHPWFGGVFTNGALEREVLGAG
jgi:hypothetical protein